MTRRLPEVSSENHPVANRFRWAFLLLALGDTGHVGFRVVAYALGGLEKNPLWVGLGALATAITVTFFYLLMLDIWRVRFDRKYGWFEYLLIASVPVRFIVMALPGNDWGSTVPPAFWGPFRKRFPDHPGGGRAVPDPARFDQDQRPTLPLDFVLCILLVPVLHVGYFHGA